MCGIGGVLSLGGGPIPDLTARLRVMNRLLAHRGPDGEGTWVHRSGQAGFAHRRLMIVDLETGHQPMSDAGGNWVTYNGEIYNHTELRAELGKDRFRTGSDTEAVLHAYRRWGKQCLHHFRGMFGFALWDEAHGTLFLARDRFGIKPLYYAVSGGNLYFASEAKALLPFLDAIETDVEGLQDYLSFQLCLAGKTLFKGVRELPPGHWLEVRRGQVCVQRYWEVYYDLDFDHTENYFRKQLTDLLEESVALHLRSDVPVGAYVSGGVDSGVVASLASKKVSGDFLGFTGRFSERPEYDESHYARTLADWGGFALHEADIDLQDFIDNIAKVIYHLDYPVAGPGSFPQFMVSRLASRSRKAVLGGQGGDEIFGGYARYLIAYFECCIKAAIDGTMDRGNFIVTYESIIPNLSTLREYKPLLKHFWRDGLFEDLDRRYFRLINRADVLSEEVDWGALGDYEPFDSFQEIFRARNIGKESYFDSMTHFDFKTLLPALLHVEDRVSMAHGLETRVPLLDHPLVELAATIPSSIKFKEGHLKHVFRQAFDSVLPREIAQRRDKMGFPVPLNEWLVGEAADYVRDLFSSQAARGRGLIHNGRVLESIQKESKFGRKSWGFLSLELWHQQFHDREHEFKRLLEAEGGTT